MNGEPRQHSSTADQIFGVAHVAAYQSQFMTLFPGDIVITGTPGAWAWACGRHSSCATAT